ncbi:MAG: DUF1501 domain-containing protein [Sedimentisphaerales bacterium]|nr:DUF1501 domain-containing protein [Sedimentisphaerales bacterium]
MVQTRRDFLKGAFGASALVSLGPVVPNFLARAAAAASARVTNDRVLVVLQLTGGNDGLNTVVPYTDDEYARNRPTLRLPTSELHKIDSSLAFHPRMGAFLRLYEEGCLSIVQGVGYANPDQSHERAMRIWHTADPERPERQTGWLGRAVDAGRSSVRTDTAAVFVGRISRPFGLNAENAVVPAIKSADDLVLRSTFPSPTSQAAASSENPLLRFVRQATVDARAMSRRIEKTAASDDYPSLGLAGDLRTVARLTRADVGIRIFFVELGGGGIGGFDNHANQLGNHCALLGQLAESVGAFVDDLKRAGLLDRVLLMTFSEFGRTVAENGRRGTGHGAAAPVFLVGSKVKGGLVGPHPSLTHLEKGSLKFHTDFRQVYATMLACWLSLDSTAVLGRHFEPLDVLET